MAFELRYYVETANGSGGRAGTTFALDSEHDTMEYAVKAAEELVESGHPVDLVRIVTGRRRVSDEAPAPVSQTPTPTGETPTD